MKTLIALFVVAMIALSGVAFAQEFSMSGTTVETIAPAETAPVVDAPVVDAVDTTTATEGRIAQAEREITPVIQVEATDMEVVPADVDTIIVDVSPVGPVVPTDSDGPIVIDPTDVTVVPGPITPVCDHLVGSIVTLPCNHVRPHVVATAGPAQGIPCAKLSGGCTVTPNDGDGDTGTGDNGTGNGSTSTSTSDSDGGSTGNGGSFSFNMVWNHPKAPTAPAAPTPAAGTLETSTPEPTATLSNDGPDPALIGLADGRNEVVEAPVVTPATSPATGLFTGSNTPLIGIGILILIGAALYVRGKKN